MSVEPSESVIPNAPAPDSEFAGLLKWVSIVFGAMAGLFCGAALLFVFGMETGAAALIQGILCAVLPVPFYMAILLWAGGVKPKRAWMLFAALFWGATVAAFFSYFVTSASAYIVGKTASAVISAPIIEECTKAAILLIFYLWGRTCFDGVADGILYAGMAGLGFAMSENVLYYAREIGPGKYLIGSLMLRAVLSPFAHPFFTSMTGMALGMARESKSVAAKLLVPPAGLAVAILLHVVWNAIGLGDGIGGLCAYFFFAVPLYRKFAGRR